MIYCPYENNVIFWHTHVSFSNELKNAIQTNGRENPKTSPSHWWMWTASNTTAPGPTPLTTPNSSLIASCTFAQLHHKVPIGGTPHIHPKIAPLCETIANPNYLPHFWTQLTYHPKWHPDPVIRFPQSTGQADGPADGLGDKTCTNTHLCCIDCMVTIKYAYKWRDLASLWMTVFRMRSGHSNNFALLTMFVCVYIHHQFIIIIIIVRTEAGL